MANRLTPKTVPLPVNDGEREASTLWPFFIALSEAELLDGNATFAARRHARAPLSPRAGRG